MCVLALGFGKSNLGPCVRMAFGIVWLYGGERAGWVLAHRDLVPSQSVECEQRAVLLVVHAFCKSFEAQHQRNLNLAVGRHTCNLFTEASSVEANTHAIGLPSNM